MSVRFKDVVKVVVYEISDEERNMKKEHAKSIRRRMKIFKKRFTHFARTSHSDSFYDKKTDFVVVF